MRRVAENAEKVKEIRLHPALSGVYICTPMSVNVTPFEGYTIRRHYDGKKEIWYFSVTDIIQALIQQTEFQTARKYWNKLKQRLQEEGSQVVTN